MKYMNRFRVAPGSKVKLKDIDPGFKDRHENHKEAADEIEQDRKKLWNLQELLYADGKCSLLIVLQGMDTGGKDGTISHILGAMNPQGCRVVGFKQPSVEELAHDFFWRIHQAAPSRGAVAIFNRSHYEDVLIVRVHNLVPHVVWSGRYDQINAFESELISDNTHILKFYLPGVAAAKLGGFGFTVVNEHPLFPVKVLKVAAVFAGCIIADDRRFARIVAVNVPHREERHAHRCSPFRVIELTPRPQSLLA